MNNILREGPYEKKKKEKIVSNDLDANQGAEKRPTKPTWDR
jgi:hypothetical protein